MSVELMQYLNKRSTAVYGKGQVKVRDSFTPQTFAIYLLVYTIFYNFMELFVRFKEKIIHVCICLKMRSAKDIVIQKLEHEIIFKKNFKIKNKLLKYKIKSWNLKYIIKNLVICKKKKIKSPSVSSIHHTSLQYI